ncbi:hypothetical protein [Gordonia aichiensis]|uniref:Uncharacterized protein n=1 Tax=Gordonia aichiensis NBRC 108223 TaxID=1220583 RepID=L7KP56_9ACTN|nr:hypothetical protein [Gordonia aichiensis]GAC50404.1 hypothetical protein GOACH_24_00250 [Gordonia aichiensis NBRC 108223]
MTSEVPRLSQLTEQARIVADRLRSQNRPLQSVGEKQEDQTVQRFGKFGRMETVTQKVSVPVSLPGWPFGVNRMKLRSSASHSVEEVLLTPTGALVTVLIDPDEPAEFRTISNRPLHALRVAQSAGGDPTWVPTGNSGDKVGEMAANHKAVITAGEAVHRMIDLLGRLG